MRVLVACEASGIVRDAFRRKGHNAWSCDLLDTYNTESPWAKKHIVGDALEVAQEQPWDLVIAHPPCTYLTNSGVSWLHRRPERWAQLDEGARFFRAFLDLDVPRVAVENPIMHKYAIERIGGVKQAQCVQPWMFGHPERKGTCFWLKGLKPLEPTNDVKEQMLALPKAQQNRLHHLPPSKDRWQLRSQTFQGIADAMAEQWA